jgi:tetratricopeptide (TPR) repeat protein
LQSDSSIHIQRIIDKIKEGKVALFLGAGASTVAGAPRTPDLVASIKKKFDKARFTSDNFIDVCQAVIDCDYYDGRTELEDLLKEKLGNLKPSKWHLELPKYNWAAIFTTNFDDLIEESFRMAPPTLSRDYEKVLTDNFSIKRSTVQIFKLMGDILARRTDPGRMVLSRIDFIQSLKMREQCYRVLSDIVTDGTVVFIGYGGDDQLAFEIMEGVSREYGTDSLMISYMLLKDLSHIEGETLKYSKRKIVPLKCSFEEFMELIPREAEEQVVPQESIVLGISGQKLGFPSREINPILSFFNVLNEKDLEESAGNKDDFFKGINNSWGVYREKWDFEREIYSGRNGLCQRISNELQKTATSDNRVLLLTGMPGIGKSVLLRRIAFDNYMNGAPVLIFDSTREKLDFKLLDSFLMHIDRKLLDLTKGKTKCAKSIIIFDDVSAMMVDPRNVSSYLASRGRAALIICASRSHEMENDFSLPRGDIIEIPQRLSKDEVFKLAAHLRKLGYLLSTEVWRDVILKELESSFFAAMFTLVDPARRPLGKIISDQYMELSEEQKRVFLLICAFHRFELPINLELLVRVSLRGKYEKFAELLNDARLRRTVVSSEDREGNIFYSTYNRIIAQKTLDFFLPDPARQKELYSEILDNAHFVLQKERQLIEKLLIRNIGPSRNLSGLDLEDQLELFSKICRKQPTRSLVHHLGLLKTKAKDYKGAEATLLRALGLRERYTEAYRGESTRNILTSLGCLYVGWAEASQEQGDVSSSVALFQKAEKYLQDAIKYHYPMPHPYHALARMYMRMGDRCKDSPQRFDYYAQSLQTIEQGKENVYPVKAGMIYEMETLLQTRLDNREAIKGAIHVLAKDHRSARGYYLYSRALFAKARSLNGRDKRMELEEALSVIKEGLFKFPVDEPCLRIRAEIVRELYPNNDKKYFVALERWFQMSRGRSVQFLYELAFIAFKLKYYRSSFRTFSRLEKRSRGYPERLAIKNYLLDAKGRRGIYKGTVMSSRSRYLGEIRVDSLPKLNQNIRFSIEQCEFEPKEGDTVNFSIGFDYIGPKAVDVRKMA